MVAIRESTKANTVLQNGVPINYDWRLMGRLAEGINPSTG